MLMVRCCCFSVSLLFDACSKLMLLVITWCPILLYDCLPLELVSNCFMSRIWEILYLQEYFLL